MNIKTIFDWIKKSEESEDGFVEKLGVYNRAVESLEEILMNTNDPIAYVKFELVSNEGGEHRRFRHNDTVATRVFKDLIERYLREAKEERRKFLVKNTYFLKRLTVNN